MHRKRSIQIVAVAAIVIVVVIVVLCIRRCGGRGPKGRPIVIAVGMTEGSAGLKQLMLIAKTAGKALVETISPEIMKAELLEAVKEKPVETAKAQGGGGWITWLVILLILVVSGGAGFWMRTRFKKRNGGQAAGTSAASDDPE